MLINNINKMSRCPSPTELCNDRECLQYKKHYLCSTHKLHIGDHVKDKYTKQTGWVYDANPYGSKRSLFIMWDKVKDGRSGKLYFGYSTCTDLVKLPGPREKHNVSRT